MTRVGSQRHSKKKQLYSRLYMILYYWPEDYFIRSKHVAKMKCIV